MKRTVIANGIPFSMTLSKCDYKSDRAVRAIYMQPASRRGSIIPLSNDELLAEYDGFFADRSFGLTGGIIHDDLVRPEEDEEI